MGDDIDEIGNVIRSASDSFSSLARTVNIVLIECIILFVVVCIIVGVVIGQAIAGAS